MSNEERRKDNDSMRSVQDTLNALNRAVREQEVVSEAIPEVSLIERYQKESLPDVVEDESFAELTEQVAALQFSGSKRNEICKALNLEPKRYKEVVLSERFQDVKKLLAEDQKTYLLSQVLQQVDGAIAALSELVVTADEDRTKLNAAALVLEYAARLLEEQKSQFPSINNVIKNAAQSGEPVVMNLAQVIMRQREDRGLK